jgi:hypothetical protein
MSSDSTGGASPFPGLEWSWTSVLLKDLQEVPLYTRDAESEVYSEE